MSNLCTGGSCFNNPCRLRSSFLEDCARQKGCSLGLPVPKPSPRTFLVSKGETIEPDTNTEKLLRNKRLREKEELMRDVISEIKVNSSLQAKATGDELIQITKRLNEKIEYLQTISEEIQKIKQLEGSE